MPDALIKAGTEARLVITSLFRLRLGSLFHEQMIGTGVEWEWSGELA